jgi:hypothetical protein
MKLNVGELIEICVDIGHIACFQGVFAGEFDGFYILDVLISDMKIETFVRKDYVVLLKRKLEIQQAQADTNNR